MATVGSVGSAGSHRSWSPSDPGAAGRSGRIGHAVCSFWLGERCFAIDVGVVGEVVVADHLIPVPHTPPAVLGMFALRGAPIACVDLAAVLQLPEAAVAARKGVPTLVIRPKASPIAAVAIGRIDAVVATHGGVFVEAARATEHPAVSGFFTPAGQAGVITLLDPAVLFERLQALRYR